MMRKGELNFGDIVWTEFDPSVGNEYQNKRPALVVQSDKQLKRSNLVTVIPLTSNTTANVNDDILIIADTQNHLRTNSMAKVYNVVSFDYSRFHKVIGRVNPQLLSIVKQYFKKHFDL